jgi:putative ABC transport system permease protein
MFRHHLATALNNLLRQKLHALINVAGLAVGLASCLMISLFVRYEFSCDGFFPDAQSIYRIAPDFAASPLGPERYPAGNVAPLGPLLARSDIVGVRNVARIGGLPALVSRAEQGLYENGFRWADGEIFSIFDFGWLQGDQARALSEPDSVVLAESIARKYFGNEDPLGQTLLLENTWSLTVTGVFRDLPTNSHL